jgi:hypothetical protein
MPKTKLKVVPVIVPAANPSDSRPVDFDKVSTELGTLYTVEALHHRLPYIDAETARQLTADNAMPHYKVRGLTEPLFDIHEIKKWAANNLIQRERGEDLLVGVAPTSLAAISGLRKMEKDGTSGVYFLCYKGVVVYVGESENVFKRSSEHRDKPQDEVFYLLAPEPQRKKLEKEFIRRINPKHNIVHQTARAVAA